MPPKGPVVVMANHVSLWDPMALAVPFDRKIYYMAKEELFSYPVFGTILRRLGAFPVKRGNLDRAALRNAMGVLRGDEVLGIFPEGERSPTGELQEFKPGALSLAIKCNAMILPVGLVGTRKIFSGGWFRPFKVNIGKPIDPKKLMGGDGKGMDQEGLTEKVWEEIARLSRN
ncbi:MAG: 1-acyl-sn-glycerol-3-phosphate acyltransferase [Clostridia bacterium]|nr:1-acyl-sn-glycerol-3-phosphate acyltransferase [Clostridia bacterium]